MGWVGGDIVTRLIGRYVARNSTAMLGVTIFSDNTRAHVGSMSLLHGSVGE